MNGARPLNLKETTMTQTISISSVTTLIDEKIKSNQDYFLELLNEYAISEDFVDAIENGTEYVYDGVTYDLKDFSYTIDELPFQYSLDDEVKTELQSIVACIEELRTLRSDVFTLPRAQ